MLSDKNTPKFKKKRVPFFTQSSLSVTELGLAEKLNYCCEEVFTLKEIKGIGLWLI